jgi:hypothetical protein
MLSGCTHRRCDRDNRYRSQSGHPFAYHGGHSSVRLRTPALENETQQTPCGCRVRRYRAGRHRNELMPTMVSAIDISSAEKCFRFGTILPPRRTLTESEPGGGWGDWETVVIAQEKISTPGRVGSCAGSNGALAAPLSWGMTIQPKSGSIVVAAVLAALRSRITTRGRINSTRCVGFATWLKADK